jgi:hypothetical protein
MRVFAEGIVGIAMTTTAPKLAMAIADLDMVCLPQFFAPTPNDLHITKVFAVTPITV